MLALVSVTRAALLQIMAMRKTKVPDLKANKWGAVFISYAIKVAGFLHRAV